MRFSNFLPKTSKKLENRTEKKMLKFTNITDIKNANLEPVQIGFLPNNTYFTKAKEPQTLYYLLNNQSIVNRVKELKIKVPYIYLALNLSTMCIECLHYGTLVNRAVLCTTSELEFINMQSKVHIMCSTAKLEEE